MAEKVLFCKGAMEEINGEWKLVGVRCNCCGKVSYPRSERCVYCASDDTVETVLEETGVVYSFNTVRVPVGPYRPPVIGGLIDTPEGVRLYGQIRAEDGTVKAGMKLKMETGTLYTDKDGTEVFGFYYVPAED